MLFLGWTILTAVVTMGAQSGKPTIRISTNVGNPPYEYLDKAGRPSGFNNDLLRELSRVMNVTFEVRPMPFGDARDAFERGELDALGTVIYTEARAKEMDFTVPTHPFTYILLVRKGDRTIHTERDLVGKRVVVNRRNAVAEHFKAMGIGFQEMNSNEECVKALASGAADCAVAPKYTWLYLREHEGYPTVAPLPAEIYPSRRGIAVHKGDAWLLARFNEGIFKLQQDGTLDRLYARHFGALEVLEVPTTQMLKRSLGASLPILVLVGLLGLGAWAWALRRMVRSRTAQLQEAMNQLRQYQGQLEDLVDQRSRQLLEANRDLVKSKEAAEESSRLKSAFLANMSHEVRTPLHAVLLYTELLREDAEQEGRARALEDLGRIDTATRHLLNLLNDILDISKIEAGRMELACEPIRISELLQDVAVTTRPLAERNGNGLELYLQGELPELWSDPVRLRQVLINHVGNACKFTQNGRVSLLAQVHSDGVCFVVRDTGIGMDAATQARLFQEFVQGDDRTNRVYGGTGLGLALSRRLTELLGGHIEVDSEPGKGSEFRIHLPLRCPKPMGHELG